MVKTLGGTVVSIVLKILKIFQYLQSYKSNILLSFTGSQWPRNEKIQFKQQNLVIQRKAILLSFFFFSILIGWMLFPLPTRKSFLN